MIWDYISIRLIEQIKALSFVVLYLVFFSTFVLGAPLRNAIQLSVGLGLVVLGLTIFLEGLFLGLMPLGERVGVLLPKKAGLWAILTFGALLGVGSTLAEPAIVSLRIAGSGVLPWSAPLLYRMLENDTGMLFIYIGAGVGVAVAFGMLRFYYGFSIKPFIYSIVPTLLVFTVYCAQDTKLSSLLGLAWDAGAVTTGSVTVPLVLLFAFGLGYGSTLAEPALNALGRTVEELTVRTIKARAVVQAVSVGVGAGLVLGVVWIMYDFSPLWMLLPPYLLLLPLTYWSDENFSGIAWDCGGVTTGSVTVPLVLSMGLSIGGELGVADGFGILAMASAYPIISVLLYGLIVKSRQRQSIEDSDEAA